jgi:DNA-binding transcriptional regulator YiaG
MEFTEKNIQKFWRNVDIKGKEDCWLWKAHKNNDGYGCFRVKEKSYVSSRVAYFLYYGDFDETLCCLHRCDCPACCNPDHLFLGTIQDNIDDMCKKGRVNHPIGVANGKCKLSIENVLEIRNDYATGNYTKAELGKKFNITSTNVYAIVTGKTWKNIGGAITIIEENQKYIHKLNKATAKEIRLLIERGNLSQIEIARIYNVNRNDIREIKKNIIWKDINT